MTNKKSGLTLIELLIIIAIVCIVGSLFMGNSSGYTSFKDKGNGIVEISPTFGNNLSDCIAEYLQLHPDMEVQTMTKTYENHYTVVFVAKGESNANAN